MDSNCWKSAKMRLGRRTMRRTVMDSVVPYLCNFFCCYLYSPRRKVSQTVIGTTVRRGSRSKTLQLLESGYRDHFSELHDEPVGWNIIATTDRHKLHRWSLLHFFTQNLCIQLWTDFLQNKEKLI